jgi:hypothetical protein
LLANSNTGPSTPVSQKKEDEAVIFNLTEPYNKPVQEEWFAGTTYSL